MPNGSLNVTVTLAMLLRFQIGWKMALENLEGGGEGGRSRREERGRGERDQWRYAYKLPHAAFQFDDLYQPPIVT